MAQNADVGACDLGLSQSIGTRLSVGYDALGAST